MVFSKWFPLKFFSKKEKSTIMDMPHLVMEQILDNVDFLDILNLRRVCKSFRNFIDDVKPINNLEIIRIYVEYRRIRVKLVFDFEETFISCFLFYQEGPKENTCWIFRDFGEPEFVVKKDGYFVDAFLTDFEPILKNQRLKLTELEIKVNSFNYCDDYSFLSQSKFRSFFSRFLCSRFKNIESVSRMIDEKNTYKSLRIANEMIYGIGQILGSRTVPLETENLKLTFPTPSQIFRLSRFIKTDTLKGRGIYRKWSLVQKDTQVDEAISKCETLKTLEYLVIEYFVMTNQISDFSNIPELFIWRESISRDDVLIMKQAFLTNPRLKNWEVTFLKTVDHDIIHEVLGRIPNGQSIEWFFEIPNSQEILRIYDKYRSNWVFTTIVFTRINLDDVPENGLIR